MDENLKDKLIALADAQPITIDEWRYLLDLLQPKLKQIIQQLLLEEDRREVDNDIVEWTSSSQRAAKKANDKAISLAKETLQKVIHKNGWQLTLKQQYRMTTKSTWKPLLNGRSAQSRKIMILFFRRWTY